jgi:hypothetical protein
MMEAVSTPETSVNFYQTTRRNITEDSHLQQAFKLNNYRKFMDQIRPDIKQVSACNNDLIAASRKQASALK